MSDDDQKSSVPKLLGLGALIVLPSAGLLGAAVMVVVMFFSVFATSSQQAAATPECPTAGVVAGGSNVDTAMKTLMSSWKLKPHQAAGVVGNWQVEAGPNVDPKAKNEINYRGIAQWDPQQRWPKLESFATSISGDPLTLDVQLRFAAWELGFSNEWSAGGKGGYATVGADLKTADTSDEAAKIIFDRYEIPGDDTLPQRQDYARGLATKYAGGGSGAESSAPPVEEVDFQVASGAGWRVPTDTPYRISSAPGSRQSPGGIGSTDHQGVDMVLPPNAPILAAYSGTAKIAQTGYFGLGTAVILDHGGGITTTYGHMAQLDPALKPGAQVKAGQVLGTQGNTGNSTGPHLHFEVRTNGIFTNPMDFMASKGAPLNGTAGKPGTNGSLASAPGTECAPAAGSSDDFQKTLKSYIWPNNVPDGRLDPTPGYATAVARAGKEGRFYGDLPDEPAGRPEGIHCSGFLSLFMTDSGFDPTFNHGGKIADGAGWVDTQEAWLKKNWEPIGKASEIKLSDLKPGDIGISNGAGFYHAWMFIGDVPGIEGNFAEASYLYEGKKGFAPQARQSDSVLYQSKSAATYYRKKG